MTTTDDAQRVQEIMARLQDRWYSAEQTREDVRYLLARLDALEGERDAIQAAWNRDKRLSEEAIDHHMARWKRAEAARDHLETIIKAFRDAREGVARYHDLPELTDDELMDDAAYAHRNALLDATYKDLICAQDDLLKAVAESDDATLAGSREQATTEGE